MSRISTIVYLLLLQVAVLFSSCVKKDFDAPPDQSGYDPNLIVTTSIADLKKMANLKEITDELIISGVVVADDRSGNFYKQIVVQDSTGGITILLDANSLYNDYPIGRKIYLRCKGLYLGNYNDLPQIGYTPDNTGAIGSIPSTLLNDYIVKANYPNTITPKKYKLSEVAVTDVSLLNAVITIENAEFDSMNVFKKFADPAPSSGTSRTLKDCDGSSIIVRTSGYANFQPYLTPAGRGSITGIYTSYKGTPQLVIRDTSDIKFYNPRCNGAVIEPPQPAVTVPLGDVKKLYTGSDIVLPTYRIKGIVISDRSGNNTTSGKLLTLQDGDKGIVLFFSASHNFSMGDSILVDITGGTLTSFNGLLEITNVPVSNAERLGTGSAVVRQLTIAQVINDAQNLQSTLVKIVNGTILETGTTFSGNKTLTDGSGSNIIIRTNNSATFANTTVPSAPKTFTAIVSQYNATSQLLLRNSGDIQ